MTKLIVAFRNFANAPKNQRGCTFLFYSPPMYGKAKRHLGIPRVCLIGLLVITYR